MELTSEEKELLVAAAQTGEVHRIFVDQISFVRVGKYFQDDSDPAFATKYLEALESLCKRGYIVHKSGTLYKLKGSGYKKAKELAEEKQ